MNTQKTIKNRIDISVRELIFIPQYIMKKLFLALMAVAAIVLTGCKVDNEPIPASKYKPIDVRKNGKVFREITKEEIDNCKLSGSSTTLKSLRHVSRGRVYYMDYEVQIPWDNFIRKENRYEVNDFKTFNSDFNKELFVSYSNNEVLEHPRGCSGFVCKDPSGNLLMGRNLDGTPGQMMVLFNKHPKAGEYKSVMLTNLAYANSWNGTEDYNSDSSLFRKDLRMDVLLRQPIIVIDGMNEHGLCMAIYQLPNTQDGKMKDYASFTPRPISIDQQTGKKQLTFSTINYMILAKCKTVEEVEELLKSHDFTVLMSNENIHWMVADANNHWRILEYWNRYNEETKTWKDTLYVYDEISRSEGTHTAGIPVPYERFSIENYYINREACLTYGADVWQYGFSNKTRVQNMMAHYQPTMTEEEALECLQFGNFGMELPNQLTDWSCVYNPRKGTVLFNMRDDLSEVYSINIKDELK